MDVLINYSNAHKKLMWVIVYKGAVIAEFHTVHAALGEKSHILKHLKEVENV